MLYNIKLHNTLLLKLELVARINEYKLNMQCVIGILVVKVNVNNFTNLCKVRIQMTINNIITILMRS